LAYTRTLDIILGAGKTGLSDLRAQLVDTAGADVGSAVSTGFTEIGTSGSYLWNYAAWPDNHRGGVKFYSNAAPTVFLASTEVNPEDYEYIAVLINRLGAFTGSGLNTVLGFLKALGSKAAALTPSDMGGTFDNTTDSEEAIRDALTASTLTAAGIWGYSPRTLTQSAAQVAATVAGTRILVFRGDTITIALTDLGTMAGNAKVWLTVKNRVTEAADTGAQLQVEKAGLLYVNGAAGTLSDGSLVVNDAALGNITVTVKPAASSLLVPGTYEYDVQSLVGAVVQTHTQGIFVVRRDDTRAVA
jgi:hypothetical protein